MDLENALKPLTPEVGALIVYSGWIDEAGAHRVLGKCRQLGDQKTIALVLATYGGSPDSAFQIARSLQDLCQRLVLHICGPCKSAGSRPRHHPPMPDRVFWLTVTRGLTTPARSLLPLA